MFLLEEFVCLYFGPLGILLKLKKKAGSSFCCLENEAKKISAAAILLGPKKLRVLVKSQWEITRHGLSNARLKMLELLGGMYSTYF